MLLSLSLRCIICFYQKNKDKDSSDTPFDIQDNYEYSFSINFLCLAAKSYI